jgi:hypothetical protein
VQALRFNEDKFVDLRESSEGLEVPFSKPTPQESVEILGWVALLWILALAKARSAVPISTAISAK